MAEDMDVSDGLPPNGTDLAPQSNAQPQSNSDPSGISNEIDTSENNVPESTDYLKMLVTARYAEKKSDKLLGLIQRELHQSIAHSSLQNVVKFLFGYHNLFYCDCHNKIQPFKAEL